jgi:hypothetical protein
VQQHDDITLMVARRHGDGGSRVTMSEDSLQIL